MKLQAEENSLVEGFLRFLGGIDVNILLQRKEEGHTAEGGRGSLTFDLMKPCSWSILASMTPSLMALAIMYSASSALSNVSFSAMSARDILREPLGNESLAFIEGWPYLRGFVGMDISAW